MPHETRNEFDERFAEDQVSIIVEAELLLIFQGPGPNVKILQAR